MSLVAYEDSDCETDEDNPLNADVENSPTINSLKKKSNQPFLTLPEPKSCTNIIVPDERDSVKEEKSVAIVKNALVNSIQEKSEERLLFPTLPKPKTGGKIKITIPSLNEVSITQIVFGYI